MSHSLPPVGHPAREMFDVADLVAIGVGQREPMVDAWRAVCAARRVFEANPAVKRVCYIVLRAADDSLDLISVGRRGGWKREWRFGKYVYKGGA